jgi:photosystem II stability/assembly factor-like uncharacterized protein
MKRPPYLFIVFLFGSLVACKKNNSNPTNSLPDIPDTLLAWQKTRPSTSFISDVWFLNPARGFFVDTTSIYNSSDSGKTWSKIPGISDNRLINIHLLNAQRGAALSFNYVYITDDYITWKPKTSPVTYRINASAPDIQFTSVATGYISSDDGLFKTTDNGDSWNNVFNNPVNGIFFFDSNTGLVYTQSTNLSSNVYKTTDGGAHWNPLSKITGNILPGFYTMQFTDAMHGWLTLRSYLYATADGGVNWSAVNGITLDNLTDVQFLNNQTGYLSAGNEILKTTDGGKTWIRSCKLGHAGVVEIFFFDEKTGWACCSDGSVLRLKQ